MTRRFHPYKLEVPSSPETTQTALQVLRDWASEPLSPEEIERERKVALEEWRMYQIVQQRDGANRPHFFATPRPIVCP